MRSSTQGDTVAIKGSAPHSVVDRLERPMRDLRLSVIDNCNFRCRYCMPPEGDYAFLGRNQWLDLEEIQALTHAFVKLGVRRVRLTGGEPLLRPGLSQIVSSIANIEGIEDISLTTNGLLLADMAESLSRSGLKRVTVSLDTLDPVLFSRIVGRDCRLQRILDGIEKAIESGLKPVKVNCVVEKGVNDHHILDLVDYARRHGLALRFIEFMDVGNQNRWNLDRVVASSDILKKLKQHYSLVPRQDALYGEVADHYRFTDNDAEIGFISSVTKPFCHSCVRARVSADGKLYTCLFAGLGHDLRPCLKQPDLLSESIATVWRRRTNRYSEERIASDSTVSRHDIVEMFQIGG